MRISDWSSDVCSSDLSLPRLYPPPGFAAAAARTPPARQAPGKDPAQPAARLGVGLRAALTAVPTAALTEGLRPSSRPRRGRRKPDRASASASPRNDHTEERWVGKGEGRAGGYRG